MKAFVKDPLLTVFDHDQPIATQLLFGETVVILEEQDTHYIISNDYDGYKAACEKGGLELNRQPDFTHRVSMQKLFIYKEPRVTTEPYLWLPFGSNLIIDEARTEKYFVHAPDLGWVYRGGVQSLNEPSPDYIETAKQFLNCPYLYGGRSSHGIDCSALVQLSLMAATIKCPRNSSDQSKALGKAIAFNHKTLEGLKRGDFIFFKGHVGMMVDATHMIHANATAMRVSIDPLDAFTRKGNLEITTIRRLDEGL